jgi:putative transcriptional regulator
MLKFDLKHLLDDYEAKTGLRMSYDDIAEATGISKDTLKALASREDYNTTLQTISKISNTVNASPLKYLTWKPDS